MSVSAEASLEGTRVGAPQPRLVALLRGIGKSGWSYLYVAPMAILLLAFIVYPIFASLGYTFFRWNGIGDPTMFVGLDNFVRVWNDPFFWSALRNNLIFTVVVVPVQLFLALTLALILNSKKLRFAAFYRVLFFIPVVTSAAVVGVVVQLLVSNGGGTLSDLLMSFGLIEAPIDWFGNPTTAFGLIILVGIWHTLGINLIYFLAGLQTIPDELYEAAKLDGAGAFATLRYITIPMLRGVGLVILILAVLGSLQVFDLVLVITGGGPFFATDVVNTYIYRLAFGSIVPDVGLASAASFFYGLLLIAFAAVQLIFIRALRKRAAG